MRLKSLLRIFSYVTLLPISVMLMACEQDLEIPNEEKEEQKKEETDTSKVKAIDLGLSVKWANCNIGASSPEEIGNHYAWGETDTKGIYNYDTYAGTSYDAASVILKDNWRLPTRDEYLELIEKCTWTWTTRDGICGHLITGPNGNKIFMPATGNITDKELVYVGFCGNYWSSTLGSDNAFFLYFEENLKVCIDYAERWWGRTIRAVTK